MIFSPRLQRVGTVENHSLVGRVPMKCTILNRNYPPGSGITGHSANELAKYLSAAGCEVHVVTVGGDYGGGGSLKLDVHGKVHTLRALYNGKNKLLRLFSSLVEGWKMARKAAFLNQGPLISMTDPPLLNFWVGRAAKKKSIPWIYWSMDLYPEAFCASGLVTTNNPFYRYIKGQLLQAPPSRLIALGPNQSKFIQQDYRNSLEPICLPCGITKTVEPSSIPEWAVKDGKVVLGYVGNVGEAHDDTFIKAVIDGLNPEKQRFVLVAYGSKSQSVLDYAKGRAGVIVLNRVEREHLQLIDVHVVTLLPEWDHVCVPSKAVSAVCEGASVFICCSELNDNWVLLKDAAWRVDVDSNPPKIVSQILDDLTMDKVMGKRERAKNISGELLELKSKAFEKILLAVKSLQNKD